ncbi:MAG: HAMP domain-containing histidine kinase [Ignavibacteria bacterium]|nr:HAMP domain-containing histidine kinase [Ignavibacteria bacterium]
MQKKMSGGPGSVQLKLLLTVLAILIGGGTLIYTNKLVVKLQERERQIVQLYAKGIQYIANTPSDNSDITFLFENIIRPIDFPMVLSDAHDSVSIENKSNIRNLTVDSTWSNKQAELFIQEEIKKMDEVHHPIPVTYIAGSDTIVLTKIHYGDSALVQKLRYYPYVQIIVAAVFLVLGYIGFSQIKRSEQSNIWVGMAKETAHQFGTPLSSLMGWLELLKMNYADKDKVQDIAEEIENDVEKLNKITNRFSKIGSKTELKPTILGEDIKHVVEYFKRRLPQTGKKVVLDVSGDLQVKALVNSGLFEWVLENLIKNALDAIEHNDGKIHIAVKELRQTVEIEVTDNGKGIDLKHRKDVFRPGYSTKRRGWGLGLSLSKRIIEEYHRGKIFVKSSGTGAGTTFKIVVQKPKD